MDTMPRLKVVSNFGVGVDHIDLKAASERKIVVGNTPGVLDGATADMTFALLLAGARNITQGDRYARSSDFTSYDPSFMLGQEVHGSVLGIVGLGNIGYQVAKRAIAFDMKVVYHNRRKNDRAESELGVEYLSLDDLLKRADFVSLNMPLTKESTRLISSRELNLMKPSAVLVNAARGGVVDHEALLEHLISGKLHAAAIDVTEPEPLPRNHPLLKLDNLIIAPHLGSATRQTRVSMVKRSVKNLLAGLSGDPLPWRIV
jgi:glyoxylate reductase